jgi:hypothetical protein
MTRPFASVPRIAVTIFMITVIIPATISSLLEGKIISPARQFRTKGNFVELVNILGVFLSKILLGTF